MNGGNPACVTRPWSDKCAIQASTAVSMYPFEYLTYLGAYENSHKCVHDKFYAPYDLIDVDSELRGLGRKFSKCSQHTYHPDCKKSEQCWSTFAKDMPVVLPPEICPIIHCNMEKQQTPGYKLPGMKC
jgi:hypothetical protein